MHGVMDTSVGWVANGPQRSQALAAWDEGYDVFLGNMRSSPPWLNVHYSYRSARYWAFNINHLATGEWGVAQCIFGLRNNGYFMSKWVCPMMPGAVAHQIDPDLFHLSHRSGHGVHD